MSCSEFKESRFLFEEPSGIYPAMNAGLRDAKGEYLWFLNSGDECVECPDFSCLFGKNHPAGPHIFCFPVIRKYSDGRQEVYEGNLTNPHQGILYHRDVFTRVGEYDTRYKLISDCLLYDRMREYKVKVIKLSKPIAYFAMDGISGSAEGKQRSKREFRHYFLRNITKLMAWFRFFRSYL